MRRGLLIVDDSESTRKNIRKILRSGRLSLRIFEAQNGIEALQVLTKQGIDLILCDLIMPKMDGYKFLTILRENTVFQDLPVIILSIKGEVEEKVKGLNLGAWDYLAKPFNAVELLARTRVMLRIKDLQDRLKARINVLEKLSVIDELTGLYNKKYLSEYLRREFSRCQRYGLSMSYIMVDLDQFKGINDRFGHQAGDHVLKQMGIIMGDNIRGHDFAFRFGGDEFVILLSHQQSREGSLVVAERLRKAVEKFDFPLPAHIGYPSIQITVSVGVATYPGQQIATADELAERADQALYRAKNQGKNCVLTSEVP